MGHVRLGTLPQTRAWKDLIALIESGADLPDIAEGTVKATDKAFEAIQNDTGFANAVDLMTHLAIAARQDDSKAYLKSIGIFIPDNATMVDVASALSKSLDTLALNGRGHSQFGELAHNALVASLVNGLNDRFGTMIPPPSDEIYRAMSLLGREKEFGKLSRSFFSTLTFNYLDYFLSHSLGAQVGEGKAFATTNQIGVFTDALELHCNEAAEIVERFSGEWFSKHFYKGGGKIPRKKTEGFGWYAMQKMRNELKERAKINEPVN